jgi:hypothetical protein
MKMKLALLLFVSLQVLTSIQVNAEEEEVAGVFGLAPMPDDAALAVWVPLDADESISGILWYNNDGATVFPEVLAVAGDYQYPALLDQALVVGQDVCGATSGWSEFYFSSPLASATPGLFVVFRLPGNGAFVSDGVGAGVGYRLGDGLKRSWVATGEGEWGPLSPDYQMAVSPIMNTNKSGDVIRLGLDAQEDQGPEESEMPELVVSGLNVWPNPFNPQTNIWFSLPSSQDVELKVFDVRGYLVKCLVSEHMPAGKHKVRWDGTDTNDRSMASGVYLCRLKADRINLTKRITLVR